MEWGKCYILCSRKVIKDISNRLSHPWLRRFFEKIRNGPASNTLHLLRSSADSNRPVVLGFRGATARRSTTLRSPRESSSTRIRSYGLAQRQMQPPLNARNGENQEKERGREENCYPYLPNNIVAARTYFCSGGACCRATSTISGVKECGTMVFVGGLKSERDGFGKSMTTKKKDVPGNSVANKKVGSGQNAGKPPEIEPY